MQGVQNRKGHNDVAMWIAVSKSGIVQKLLKCKVEGIVTKRETGWRVCIFSILYKQNHKGGTISDRRRSAFASMHETE